MSRHRQQKPLRNSRGKMWKTRSAFWDCGKFKWSQFAPKKPKRPTEYPHLPNEASADTGVSVNVTIALPSSLIPTDASTSRRAISPTLWATRLPRSAEPCGCENRCPPRSFPTARLLDLHQTDGRGLLNQVGQDNHHSLIMRFLDQREISAPITTPIRR
jgi:hypothetical protein